MRNLGSIVVIAAAIVVGWTAHALVTWPTGRPRSQAWTESRFARVEQTLDAASPIRSHGARDNAGLSFDIDTTKGRAGSGDGIMRASDHTTPATCRLPSARSGAQIVLFGVYEGDALSSAAVGDQDVETTVVDVVIEPGEKPLHLVLSSFSTIVWRFSGAVDRVDRAVLLASPTYPPARLAATQPTDTPPSSRRVSRIGPRPVQVPRGVYAGAAGLSREQIVTVRPDDCFDYFYEVDSIKAARVAATVQSAMGRRPDVVAGRYSLAAVRLPSGVGATGPRPSPGAPRGFDPRLWEEGLRFYPAGVTRIAAADVLSEVPVTAYEILPSQMGLSQLVGAGDLIRIADGLKIVRPIDRFPAQLNGAHSTSFLLARGVPMPGGSPGHSCVIDEDTGEPAPGTRVC